MGAVASDGRLVGGRYRLVAVLGSGSMGTVWRAEDQLLDRAVAVKEIRFSAYATPQERDALLRDALRAARAAADQDHPNIVSVHDVVQDADQLWIVLRLIDGGSLGQVVRERGPLPEAEVRRIGLALLDALDAAHAEGVLHRDVKPSNVMVGTDGTVALGDFSTGTSTGTVTRTGILLGSPGYLAPERIQTGAASAAGDLFGLGATLYYAVEGRGPFDGRNLFAAITEAPTPARLAGPLTEVLDGLLARAPKDRLTSEAARALLGGIAALPAPVPPTPPVAGPPAARPDPPPAARVDPPPAARVEPAAARVGPGTTDPFADTISLPVTPATPPGPSGNPGSDGPETSGDRRAEGLGEAEAGRPIWEAPTNDQRTVDELAEDGPRRRTGVLFLVGMLVLAVLIGGGVVLRDTGKVRDTSAASTPTAGPQQPAPIPANSPGIATPEAALPTSAPPTSAAVTTPPAGRVTGAKISTSVAAAGYPCRYSASASVTVSGPTTVRYRVVSDQNGSSAIYTATFTKAGTRQLTAPQGQSHRAGPGWVELRVVSPTATTRRATFSLPASCTSVDVSISMTDTTHTGGCVIPPSWNAVIQFTARYAPHTFTYTLWRDGEKILTDTISAPEPNKPVTDSLSWRSRDSGDYYVTVQSPGSGTSNRVHATVTCR